MTFSKAKKAVLNNLEIIQTSLVQYTEEEGMLDSDDTQYNELLGLIEDAHIIETWDELMEIVSRAKTIETDIDTWLSLHARTSMSLSWPMKDQN